MVKVVISILFLALMACNTTGKVGGTRHPVNALIIAGGYSLDRPDNHDLDHRDRYFSGREDNFSNNFTFHAAYERKTSRRWLDYFMAYDYVPFDQHSTSKADPSDEKDISLDINTLSAGVKVGANVWKVRPFALLGAGGMHIQTPQVGNPSGAHAIGGLGADIPIEGRWSLQILGTYTKGLNFVGDDMTDYRYGNVAVGLRFEF